MSIMKLGEGWVFKKPNSPLAVPLLHSCCFHAASCISFLHALIWWCGALPFIMSLCIYDGLAIEKRKRDQRNKEGSGRHIMGEQLTLCTSLTFPWITSPELTIPSFKAALCTVCSSPINLSTIKPIAAYTRMSLLQWVRFLTLCHSVLHSFLGTTTNTTHIWLLTVNRP